MWVLCGLAAEKSAVIVSINGSKYYIHTVQAGDTLFGLAKTYEVAEQAILQSNPAVAQGLQAGSTLKIPFVPDVVGRPSEKRLRKTFDTHRVAQGETLYAISRQYEIPIPTIIEDNPSLDPIRLRPGERILIRKKKIGSEDEPVRGPGGRSTVRRSTASPIRAMPTTSSPPAKRSIRSPAGSVSPSRSCRSSTADSGPPISRPAP